MDAKNTQLREGRQGEDDEIAAQLVDAAVSLHKGLGPGLLESVCVAALEIESAQRGLACAREVPINARYLGKPLGVGHRADLIVDSKVRIELKSVDALVAAHPAQVLSYLRLSGLRVALLMNFSAPPMKRGIKRFVNDF